MTYSRVVLIGAVCALAACHNSAAPGTPGGPALKTKAGAKYPASVTLALIAQGDSLFNANSCAKCHGKGGVGATNGPDLTAGKWQHGTGSLEDIVHTITTGVPAAEIKDPTHKFNMRARGGVQPLLSDEQVKAIGAYVYKISHP